MKFFKITTLLILLLLPLICMSQKTILLNKGEYGYGSLHSKEYQQFQYYIPSGNIGVFTLKNTNWQSDLDIYLYNASGSLLSKGERNGSLPDIASTYYLSGGRYVYIYVKNNGNALASYEVRVESIDFLGVVGEVLGEMALKELSRQAFNYLFDIDENSPDYENIDLNYSRAMDIFVSVVNAENTNHFVISTVLSELNKQARAYFGYGHEGDFVVKYFAKICTKYYKHYY